MSGSFNARGIMFLWANSRCQAVRRLFVLARLAPGATAGGAACRRAAALACMHTYSHNHTHTHTLSLSFYIHVHTSGNVPYGAAQTRGGAYRPIDTRSPDPVCVELLVELQGGRTMTPLLPSRCGPGGEGQWVCAARVCVLRCGRRARVIEGQDGEPGLQIRSYSVYAFPQPSPNKNLCAGGNPFGMSMRVFGS